MKKIIAKVKTVEVPRPQQYKDCALEDAIIQSASDSMYDALAKFGIEPDDLSDDDYEEFGSDALLMLDYLIRRKVADKYGVNTDL